MNSIKRRCQKNNKNKKKCKSKIFIANREKEMVSLFSYIYKVLKPLSRFHINNSTNLFYEKNELRKGKGRLETNLKPNEK